jgi:hypothetical protein
LFLKWKLDKIGNVREKDLEIASRYLKINQLKIIDDYCLKDGIKEKWH